MRKKKGQTSTEYLIILAVVVIIALIVVGVLSSFPSIGRGTSNKASAAYWVSAPIGIMSYDLSDDAASNSLRIINNMPSKIKLTMVKIGSTSDNIDDTQIESGAIETIQLTTFECSAKESYSYEVAFTYDNEATGEKDLVFTGEVNLEGVCLNG